MLIPVAYLDGKHDQVKDSLLSRMIDEKSIAKFKRSSGWIDISSDSIRKPIKTHYDGPERRQHELSIQEMIDIF